MSIRDRTTLSRSGIVRPRAPLGPGASVLTRLWCALWCWMDHVGPYRNSRRLSLRLSRSLRSSRFSRTGVSQHHTMAGGDVRGDSHGRLGPAHSDRVVGSRESDGSQNGAGLVAVASANLCPVWHWPLRMARYVREWATRGGERRNAAAYDKGISLGVCRTVLGVSVNDAGSIFWCARARRLVYSAAQRARRAVSSLAQWQRPRMWIYVAAPHPPTKPSRGCLRVVVRKPRLVLAEFRATWNKVTATHPCDVRGCPQAKTQRSKVAT